VGEGELATEDGGGESMAKGGDRAPGSLQMPDRRDKVSSTTREPAEEPVPPGGAVAGLPNLLALGNAAGFGE
jgi:hypothetical protein